MPVLTLVADRKSTSLDAAIIARVRDAVQGEAPDVLSEGEAVDITCDAPDRAAVAQAATEALDGRAIDVAILPQDGRRKRLLVADMDSTIVTTETLDELAAFAGLKAEIAAITEMSISGTLDFAEALRRRVAMLEGLSLDALHMTFAGVALTDGAAELVATMRANGAVTALVSGGFTYFTSRVAARAGFDVHRANVLVDDGSALTGAVEEPILDRDAKLTILRELSETHGFGAADSLAIGDGANDLAMIRAAGLGVAFHAKPVLRAAAAARIDHAGLRAALFYQGYRAGDLRGG